MSRTITIAAAIFISLCASVRADRLGDRSRSKQSSNSERIQKSKVHYGILGGVVAGGMAHVEGWDYKLSSADSWEVFVDLPTTRRLVPRLSLDLHKVTPEVFHRSRYLYDVSVALIFKEEMPKRGYALHPGVGLGYGRISDETFRVSGDFLMVKMHLEIQWFFRPAGAALVAQVGMVAAPFGRGVGGEKVSADFRPIIRFGLAI